MGLRLQFLSWADRSTVDNQFPRVRFFPLGILGVKYGKVMQISTVRITLTTFRAQS